MAVEADRISAVPLKALSAPLASPENASTKDTVMIMKLRNLGWAAACGMLAVSLAGCAAPADNQGVAVDQSQAAQQATASRQDDAKANGQTQEQRDAAAQKADEATAKQEAAQPAELQIVDSGWFASDNGMVDFVVEVQNPNHTVEAVAPVIEAVGKDEAGNVLFDEKIETPAVLPDSTYYYSYVTGTPTVAGSTDEVVKPATVDFTIATPEGSWKATDEKLADTYAVQDNGVKDSEMGAKEFTGTVTASKALDNATQSRVDVVLLDKDGHIEGGYFKVVDTEPGKAVDYDIFAIDAPDYASYAVYASPWNEDVEK